MASDGVRASLGSAPPSELGSEFDRVGGLDALVEDGQAIGVRVVLDLTAMPAGPPSHADDPRVSVDVPDDAAALLVGLSAYGF